MIHPGRPPGRRPGHATPLQIIDGDTIGPDGRPLSAFARFKQKIEQPSYEVERAIEQPGLATLTPATFLLLDDGSTLVAAPDAEPYLVRADGTVEALSLREPPDGD